MTPFALTIPLSAFLLFLVQPVLGRYLVPRFGGGAGVWTACMLFFQVVLLGGYGYAHLLAARLAWRRQAMLHGALLLASLAFLPLAPAAAAARPGQGGSPTLAILLLLLTQVGLPYLLLSATGPLLQTWFCAAFPDRSPYRLYALSNAGSLLALLCYPLALESSFTLHQQGVAWSAGYGLFALACGAAAWRTAKLRAPAALVEAGAAAASPRPALVCFWLLLAAAGSVTLLATTNRLCQDLAAMPLLWVLPLALYLLTFIVCFERDRWYDRRLYVPLLLLGAAAATALREVGYGAPLWLQCGTCLVALLAACMVCHGELARSRPGPRHLTLFYLVLAGGGAVGGALTAVVAPAFFSDYWEYEVGLLGSCLLAFVAILRTRRADRAPWRRWALAAGYAAFLGLVTTNGVQAVDRHRAHVDSARSFYGVLHVQRVRDAFDRPVAELLHGGITHGLQFLDPDRRRWPTSYYGRDSGIGITVHELAAGSGPDRRRLRIGVIGLGTGTIAALAGPGDHVRFYEINPDVERVARQHFSFLADTAARVDVVLGDARLVLEDELRRGAPQGFDVLAIDAFNSDAIPVHLLTREAFRAYEQHLADDCSVLAFHVSNRYVDLEPVVRGLARPGGYRVVAIVSTGDIERNGTWAAHWLLVTRNERLATAPEVLVAAEPAAAEDAWVVEWNDDFASLLPVMSLTPRVGRWERAPNSGRFVVDRADLIAPEDEERMLRRLRALYHDTAGRCPLLVIAVPDLAEEYAGPDGFADYKRVLLDRLGVAGAQHAAVLLGCAGRRAVSVELGPGWPAAAAAQAQEVLHTTVLAALDEGRPSAGFVAGAEALEGLLRRECAAAEAALAPAPRD